METVKKSETTENDIKIINQYSKRELNIDEVYTFSVVAADSQVDRDMEQFSVKALSQLAELFKGKSVIFDHTPTAQNQTARIFNSYTQEKDSVTQLICQAYMLKENNNELISKIESGILKEVSVGCSVNKRICSVCGKDICHHVKGRVYDGVTCCFRLDEAVDAYELSFVAVPAQRGAGVIKCVKSFNASEGQQKAENDDIKENLALKLKLKAAENYLKEIEINGNE